MKISVFRQDLIGPLSHMASIIERRAAIPILMNVKIEAEGGQLTLTATNVDLELVERVRADITLGGKITIPVHLFHDIVNKLPKDAEIRIEQSGEMVVVSAGKSRFTLNTLSAESFPMMAGANLSTRFSISTDDLKALIDNTKFAIPTDDSRYYLSGIHLHTGEKDGAKILCAVATDSQRLALYNVPLPAGAEGLNPMTLPRRMIGELRKLIDDAKVDDVVVESSETKVKFTLGDAVMTSKLVDAQYPNYNVVIPKNNDKVATIAREPFIEMIDRVSVASSDKVKSVLLEFSQNHLVAKCSTPNAGEAVEDADIKYNGGDSFPIAFNVMFLLDISRQISGAEIQIIMADPLSPTIIQSAENSDALCILMPMRT